MATGAAFGMGKARRVTRWTSSVVPLDKESPLKCTKADTGFRDFGSDGWYESLSGPLKALNEEAHLNLVGFRRSDLLICLEQRLLINRGCLTTPPGE
jgi:hypothetical protein